MKLHRTDPAEPRSISAKARPWLWQARSSPWSIFVSRPALPAPRWNGCFERHLYVVPNGCSPGALGTGARQAIRVGLIIGVHRNFVREIRTTRPQVQLEKVQHRHRGSALLQAWASDWQFLTSAGHPRDLPIRAAAGEPSFETLVRRHLSGVSTGTAIAELQRSGAVRLLPDERIRLRSRTARPSGITLASITAASDRMRELASTLLHNLKRPEDQRFCETAHELQFDPQRLAYVREMIAKRARTFLGALMAELDHEALKALPGAKAQAVQVGLMICAYEDSMPAARA